LDADYLYRSRIGQDLIASQDGFGHATPLWIDARLHQLGNVLGADHVTGLKQPAFEIESHLVGRRVALIGIALQALINYRLEFWRVVLDE